MHNTNLKEKIAQMLILGFEGSHAEQNSQINQDLIAHPLGGVILFNQNITENNFNKNIQNPEQLKSLCQQLKKAASTKTNLPLLIAIDYEGGHVNRLKTELGFIDTISAYQLAQCNEEQAMNIALKMSKELSQLGINFNFAPVVDLRINPDNPIIAKLQRSFSHNPHIVEKYAYIMARAFTKHNILFAYKHFPGHGSANSDSHAGFVDVTSSWQECELEPFKSLINKKIPPPAIMSAHIVNKKIDSSGLPATLSHQTINNLLRKKLNFSGLIVSDDLQMQAITNNYDLQDTLILAINAGINLLVFGNQLGNTKLAPVEIIDLIYKNTISGKINKDNIEKSFQLITKYKQLLYSA